MKRISLLLISLFLLSFLLLTSGCQKKTMDGFDKDTVLNDNQMIIATENFLQYIYTHDVKGYRDDSMREAKRMGVREIDILSLEPYIWKADEDNPNFKHEDSQIFRVKYRIYFKDKNLPSQDAGHMLFFNQKNHPLSIWTKSVGLSSTSYMKMVSSSADKRNPWEIKSIAYDRRLEDDQAILILGLSPTKEATRVRYGIDTQDGVPARAIVVFEDENGQLIYEKFYGEDNPKKSLKKSYLLDQGQYVHLIGNIPVFPRIVAIALTNIYDIDDKGTILLNKKHSWVYDVIFEYDKDFYSNLEKSLKNNPESSDNG